MFGDENGRVLLMSCVVEEEWLVGWFGNLSGTYWIIVIRPQLSRSATIEGYTSNRPSFSIFNWPKHVLVSLWIISSKIVMQLHPAHDWACCDRTPVSSRERSSPYAR